MAHAVDQSARPAAGEIVIVDWRRDRRPDEPGNVRPAVVLEAEALFPDGYPNLIVVPLTRDSRFGLMSALVERILPTDRNGATDTCWAVCHHVSTVSRNRVRPTGSCVTAAQLASMRAKLALAVGLGA